MSKRGSEDLLISPNTLNTNTKKLDDKLSPLKESSNQEISMEEKHEVLVSINETAPSWFVQAFSFIMSELNSIKNETQKIEHVRSEIKKEVNVMDNKIRVLETVNAQQELELKALKRQIINLESNSRKDNLLISGISENPGENIATKVKIFFKEVLKLDDGDSIQLAKVHRLGQAPFQSSKPATHPRTVIVKFHTNLDRDRVWRASWKINNKKYQVREDFPEAVLQNRRILLPYFKAARKDTQTQKSYLKGDTLILDGHKYTVEDVEKIPSRLRWTTKGERYIPESNATYFFGKQCYLSNFYPSPFTEGQTEYSCCEQYYLEKKCLNFNDDATASAIKMATTPEKMKALAKNIKGLDEKLWKPHAKKTMEKAVFLKFSQNPKLKKQLLDSRGLLVEACKHDNVFSCGLSLADPSIKEQSKWTGTNWLGEILMQVRETLKNN